VLIECGGDVNKTDTDNWTPLHAAASDGTVESVMVLVKGGADINARDSLRRTPLLLAVLNRSVEKAKALLELGADIKLYDEYGRGVLHYAVNEANVELLSLLLQSGAVPDGEDVANPNHETSFSPLHLAAKLGDGDCVKALLSAGAAASRVDQDGLTPRQYAEREGHPDVAALFSSSS
jgi:ankyrin repeat protein